MILQGDCLTVLPTISAGAASACVTSPPYYGLRDYNVPPTEWPACEYAALLGVPAISIPPMTCALGQEPTPEAFIAHLTLIFREVRRILPASGTLLVNMGDSYSSSGKTGESAQNGSTVKQGAKLEILRATSRPSKSGNVPKKNLLGIPWRLAFALQADGWVLRQEIIWHKPNPMPESVGDRCTKAHEHIFLLSKQASGYYWDAESIAEPLAAASVIRLGQDLEQQEGSHRVQGKDNGPMKAVKRDSFKRENSKRAAVIPGQSVGTHRPDRAESAAAIVPSLIGRLSRSGQTAGSDLADMDVLALAGERPQLARALELAAEHQLTSDHLEALRAVGLSSNTARGQLQTGAGKNSVEAQRLAAEAEAALGSYAREFLAGTTRNARTVWTVPTVGFKEAHFAVMSPLLAERMVLASTPPGGTVLDPFYGSGTTGRAAWKHGREVLGIELHPDNVALAQRLARQAQPGLALVGTT